MSSLRRATAAVLAAGALAARPATAGLAAFDAARFSQAREAGRTVLLQFTGGGCPACEDQARLLERLLARPPFEVVEAFSADLDGLPQLASAFRVTRSGTLVLYAGRLELGRAAGLSAEEDLRALLMRGVRYKPWGRPKARPANRIPPRP